jgi:hypothetical protein
MKKNSLRGEILRFLRDLYPDGANETMLISVLYHYHKVEDIEEAVEYLTDKEYIQKKESPHPYREQEQMKWYKLSPKGVDLVEGNIEPDPGILLAGK